MAVDTLGTDRLWRPATQQPPWRAHPAWDDVRRELTLVPPLVTADELATLRAALACAAAGDAVVLQAGDCAESFYDSVSAPVARLRNLETHAHTLNVLSGLPVVRIGRIAGQYAKPRSQDQERVGGKLMPAFRGHLVNSELPTAHARVPDPRRMLVGYRLSATSMRSIAAERAAAAIPAYGPWSSHEALVLDYEIPLLRGGCLTSTHLPWIGERTRHPEHAHVQLLQQVRNPVGCKVSGQARQDDLVRLCHRLDPDREPGKLVLIARFGNDAIDDALPALVHAVANAGHPAVWLSDPMHGNTVKTATGVKTRYLHHIVAELEAFVRVLRRHGAHPGGLHLEATHEPVTECLAAQGDQVPSAQTGHATLCDPRLNPDQTTTVLAALARAMQ